MKKDYLFVVIEASISRIKRFCKDNLDNFIGVASHNTQDSGIRL